MGLKINIEFDGDLKGPGYWVGTDEEFAARAAAALVLVPEVKEFLGTGKDQVPQRLVDAGWGWIGPDGTVPTDQFVSPGLSWSSGPGMIEVLL